MSADICPKCGRHRSDPRDYLVIGIEGGSSTQARECAVIRVRAYTDEEAIRQAETLRAVQYYPFHDMRLRFRAEPYGGPPDFAYGEWTDAGSYETHKKIAAGREAHDQPA